MGGEIVIPLSCGAEDQDMELVRIKNEADQPAVLIVSGTNMRYGIAPQGTFTYIGAGEAFVETFDRISCWVDDRRDICDVCAVGAAEIRVRDGRHRFTFISGDGTGTASDMYQPIKEGAFSIEYDGTVLIHGYEFGISAYGNPVVYAQKSIAFDSKGYMIPKRGYRKNYVVQHPVIQAASCCDMVLTSQREVLIGGERVLEQYGPVVRLLEYEQGLLLQMKDGKALYSAGDEEWTIVSENACAVAADGILVAVAECNGIVRILRLENMEHIASFHLSEGRYVSEMKLTSGFVVLLYSDSVFDILDFYGHSLIGTVYIPPIYPVFK